jgi:adenine C2-methylase RlmN of 23S rRNA A2503 and tRNA A37
MGNGIFVTISRLWNQPEIFHLVNDEGISISMSLENFIAAVKQEIGPVTWTFKAETFEKQVDEAVEKVVRRIKEESAKVM